MIYSFIEIFHVDQSRFKDKVLQIREHQMQTNDKTINPTLLNSDITMMKQKASQYRKQINQYQVYLQLVGLSHFIILFHFDDFIIHKSNQIKYFYYFLLSHSFSFNTHIYMNKYINISYV